MMNMEEDCDSYAKVIPTGSMRLDLALPLGGLPRGKIIEIAGTPSSGKSTLSLHIISEAQKKGGICAFIDTEHSFPPIYATRIGIDKQTLLISLPETAEEALQIVDTLTSSYALDLIVIDSVTALAPRAEIQSEMGDFDQGRQARLLSQILPELAYAAKQSNTCLIFTSQTRHQSKHFYGKKASTSSTLNFHASVRLELDSKRLIKSGTTYIGQRTLVKITKPPLRKSERASGDRRKAGETTTATAVYPFRPLPHSPTRSSPPFKKTQFDIYFGQGISKSSDLFSLGTTLDLIKKRDSFYYYLNIPLGRTHHIAKQRLAQTPSLSYELEHHIRQLIALP